MHSRRSLFGLIGLCAASSLVSTAALAQRRVERLVFRKGNTGVNLSSIINGNQSRDYLLRVLTNQRFLVAMFPDNDALRFQVIASDGAAVWDSFSDGNNAEIDTHRGGDWIVRFSQSRTAALAGYRSSFRASITVLP
jgi:hypothetical protein